MDKDNIFESFIKKLSGYFEWVGAIGIIIMLLTNIVDVVGSKLFQWPLPGVLEIVSFAHIIAIAPAIAMGLFLGTHLSIDFILEKFPGPLKTVFRVFVSVACILLFVLLFIESMKYGYNLKKSREMGVESKLPFYPFVYVISICCIPIILFFLIDIVKIFSRKR